MLPAGFSACASHRGSYRDCASGVPSTPTRQAHRPAPGCSCRRTGCTPSSWVSSSRWRATGCSTSGLLEHSVQQFACTPQRIAPRGNRIIRDVTTRVQNSTYHLDHFSGGLPVHLQFTKLLWCPLQVGKITGPADIATPTPLSA